MTDCGSALRDDKRIRGMISLAKKAGKVKSGEDTLLESLDSGRLCLMLIASDASDNTKKRFSDKCSYRGIPFFFYGTMEELGGAVGTGERACVAVTDRGFAEAIEKLIAAKGA